MSTYSKEHKLYLQKQKKEKRLVTISRLMIVILFLVIWELLSKYNVINSFLSSRPSEVLKTIITLWQENTLFMHIGITIYEVLLSFAIATIIGFVVATILWRYEILAKIIDPFLTILNSLPKVALGPLIIIWVGASINSIIFMSLLISTFITIITIYQGFKKTPTTYITLLKTMNANNIQIFTKAVLPSNIPTILNALKINISMSLIGLLPPVGENFIV